MVGEIVSVACALVIGGYVGTMVERARILRRMQIAANAICVNPALPVETRQLAGAVLDALNAVAAPR